MVQLAQYQGTSLISRIIRLLTYSCYSHSAILFTEDVEVDVAGKIHVIPGGSVFEAWKGGVKLSVSLSDRHSYGTRVDLFKTKIPMKPEQQKRMANFLMQHVGKGYDYWNVLRFIPLVRLLMRKPAPSPWTRKHVFCSELALQAFADAGINLLERCSFWEVPPRDPPRSPLLMTDRTIYTR